MKGRPAAVRPEFGPTLPALLAQRRGMRPRTVGIAFLAAVLVLGALLATRGPWADPRTEIVHDERAIGGSYPVFRISYPEDVLRRATPSLSERGPDLERLVGRRRNLRLTITVRRFQPTAKIDIDPFGSLPLHADQHIRALQSSLAGFDLRAERHLRVNWDPGYDIRFRYRDGRARMYGRDMIAFPTETARDGAVLLSLRHRLPGKQAASDAQDDLAEAHRALRSFAFGLD
jgi:hypothetical protein